MKKGQSGGEPFFDFLEKEIRKQSHTELSSAAGIIEALKRNGEQAVAETREIVRGQEKRVAQNRLRTLRRWKVTVKAWRYFGLLEAIEQEIEDIKAQGTARSRKSAPYHRAAAVIVEILAVYNVKYASYLAGCVLWYMGFSDEELRTKVGSFWPGDRPVAIYERGGDKIKLFENGMRERLREYQRASIEDQKRRLDRLPDYHPDKQRLSEAIEIGEKLLKTPRKRRRLEAQEFVQSLKKGLKGNSQ